MSNDDKPAPKPSPTTKVEKSVPLRESNGQGRTDIGNESVAGARDIRKSPLNVSERVPIPPPPKKK